MNKKVELVHIVNTQGLMRVTDSVGKTGLYRLKGIVDMREEDLKTLVKNGSIHKDWNQIPEVPSYVKIFNRVGDEIDKEDLRFNVEEYIQASPNIIKIEKELFSINRGVFQLVDKVGCITLYRQGSINSLEDMDRVQAIVDNRLDEDWSLLPEVPKYVTIMVNEKKKLREESYLFTSGFNNYNQIFNII